MDTVSKRLRFRNFFALSKIKTILLFSLFSLLLTPSAFAAVPTFTAEHTSTTTTVVSFSETVDGTLLLSDWTIGGVNPTAALADVSGAVGGGTLANDSAITFTHLDIATDATQTVTYTSGDISDDGNANQMADGTDAVATDGIAPTVLFAYSSNPAKAGDITIMATYSEPITFDATDPSMSITQQGTTDSGSLTRAGPDTTTFSYTYTVVADNGSTYQDGTATVHLSSVDDGHGNVTGELTDTFEIDTTAPTAALTYSDTDGVFREGQMVTITATFDEPMADSPVVNLATDNGLDPTAMTKVNDTSYTFELTIAGGNLSPTVSLSVGTDIAGNVITATPTSGATFEIDNTSPVISATAPVANTSINTQTVSYTLDETVHIGSIIFHQTAGTDAGGVHDCALQGTALEAGAHANLTLENSVNACSGWTDLVDGATYTVTFTAMDAAENAASIENTNVVYDTTAPTYSYQFSANPAKAGEMTITRTYSEPIVGTQKISINQQGTEDESLGDMSSGDQTVWTYLYTVVADNGGTYEDGTVFLMNTQTYDSAGNTAVLQGTNTFTIDTTAPTVAVTMDDSDLSIGETALVTFTFDEDPMNFDETDVISDNGVMGAITVTGDSLIYTGTFTPNDDIEDASNNISAETSWTDLAGNAPESTNDTPNYTIDTKEPTFAIQYYTDSGLSEAVTDNSRLKAGTYYIKITSNESLSSFPTISINAEGTANDVTNGTTTNVSGNDYKYTRTIVSDALAIGTTLEDLSITGTDNALNTATDINPTNEGAKAMYTDTTKPTIGVVAAPDTLKKRETSTITFTLSEAATNFIMDDVLVIGGTLDTWAGSGTSYTAVFTPTDESTTPGTINVTTDMFTDEAGNFNLAASEETITIDTEAPTLTSAIFTDSDLSIGETSVVTFTFSEVITGFSNDDLTIPNGTFGGEVSSSDGGTTWTATFTPTDDIEEATNVIAVAMTGVSDSAGNAGVGSTNSSNYAIDTKEPTYTVDAASIDAAGDTIILTFSEGMDVTTITTALLQADTNITLDYSDDAGNTNEANITVANATVAWTGTTIATITLDEATDAAYIPDGKFIGVTLSNVTDVAGNAEAGAEVYSPSIDKEEIAPTVTKLGTGLIDFVIPVGTPADLVFGEVLSSTAKTIIETALTTGANNAPTYSWTGATLTITAHASGTMFYNDVLSDITDLVGNTTTDVLLIDSRRSGGGSDSCKKPSAFDFSPQEKVSSLGSFSFFVAPPTASNSWKDGDWVKEQLTITVDGETISTDKMTVALTEHYTSKVTVSLPSVINTTSTVSIVVSANGSLKSNSCKMNQLFTVDIVNTPSTQSVSSSGGGGSSSNYGGTPSAVKNTATEKTTTPVKKMRSATERFTEFAPQDFKDVSSQAWERPFVDKVSSAGIMTGYANEEGVFGKNDAVTNAQLIKVGLESFGFDIPDTVVSAPFKDVTPDAWFAPYLLKAKELGITPHVLNNKVHPNKEISRGETLRLLLSFADVDLSEVSTKSRFSDVSSIQGFTKAIVWATENGIVDGYKNGKFGPHDSLTRGQLAKIVVNLIEFLEIQ